VTTTSTTLRDSHDELGSRYLAASLSADGTLTIEGQDHGDGVEQVFGPGNREYEWTWKIESKDVVLLKSALRSDDDVLVALAEQFSNDAAAGLKPFLDEHGIPHECWSRIGD
jgi:hypothetical protein